METTMRGKSAVVVGASSGVGRATFVRLAAYFGRYAAGPPVRFEVARVEGRPALLAYYEGQASPSYFVLLEWSGERVVLIRDYRYAPYVAEDEGLAIAKDA